MISLLATSASAWFNSIQNYFLWRQFKCSRFVWKFRFLHTLVQIWYVAVEWSHKNHKRNKKQFLGNWLPHLFRFKEEKKLWFIKIDSKSIEIVRQLVWEYTYHTSQCFNSIYDFEITILKFIMWKKHQTQNYCFPFSAREFTLKCTTLVSLDKML